MAAAGIDDALHQIEAYAGSGNVGVLPLKRVERRSCFVAYRHTQAIILHLQLRLSARRKRARDVHVKQTVRVGKLQRIRE